jgi:hypothetical protein
MISNFTFLPPAFKDLAEAARKAESSDHGRSRRRLFPLGTTEAAVISTCLSEKITYFSDR